MRHVMVVRLDSLGDVLVCGPAIRAVAARADRVSVLASTRGAPAARLLPGVDDVLEWDCPWITSPPPPVRADSVADVVARIRAAAPDEALVLTSFHQSALPTALVLSLAGVPRIAAISEDHPGALLTTRISPPPDDPEPVRMAAVAAAAGFLLPPDDDGRLRLRPSDGSAPEMVPENPYVVVHPGVDASARAYPEASWRAVVGVLTRRGRTVVVTGAAGEAELCARVAGGAARPESVVDRCGRTSLTELAEVLGGADMLLAGNTGPAHLAAAVGTPVVSLFAPVVPAVRWAPYGVPTIVLGDQHAPCADTRSRVCPVAGHPCLGSVRPAEVADAAETLADPALAGIGATA